MRQLLFPLILALSFYASQGAANSCKRVHAGKMTFAERSAELVDLNLLKLQHESSQTKTAKEIHAGNQNLIKEALNLPIGKDFKYLDEAVADGMIIKIRKNKVAGNHERFEREDAEVGYCFGRATCGHLQALKSGFKKEQIKKAWLVGPMVNGDYNWGYHVALIVRDRHGAWWVIDTNYDGALPLAKWYKNERKTSTDNKLELFITDPEKFGPYAGKYSRTDLGFDGPKELDYYKGYFPELMKSGL